MGFVYIQKISKEVPLIHSKRFQSSPKNIKRNYRAIELNLNKFYKYFNQNVRTKMIINIFSEDMISNKVKNQSK